MGLQVMYSNRSNLPDCDVGIITDIKSVVKDEAVHTGDIVLVWHGHYVGTDDECWYPNDHLTTVLFDQFRRYGNDIREKPFVMFYKKADFNHDYKVQIVKKYTDIVDGEHWTFKGGCSISYKNKVED